jgi:hypothetical protein
MLYIAAAASKSWTSAAVCWLMVGVAAAQNSAPVVPTDHYGPPVCAVGKASAGHRMTAEAARAEQETGARTVGAMLSAESVENFGIERYKLADYADCVGEGGCYWADLDAQYKRAEKALDEAKKHSGEKLAVVMDIDETTLSSYCEMERESFGYVGAMFNEWVVSPEAAVGIPGALRLFNEAKADGFAVFFITGRPGVQPTGGSGDQTAATARNLEAAGFRGWTGLRLRNGDENSMTTIAYKSQERKKIVRDGYRIVMSVGDQWSDLLGEPEAGVSVKLPNPFYFLP